MNTIKHQVRGQVYYKVEQQVWGRVYGQVSKQVWLQIWNKDLQVLIQVRNQIWDQTEEDLVDE